MSRNVKDTLESRNSTHGLFENTAKFAQDIKGQMRQGNWDALNAVQKETLEMIATKIARVLSGNPADPEHWHDLAGYATLAEEEAEAFQEMMRNQPVSAGRRK